MIRGDWQVVLKAADKGLAEELDPRQEQFLKLLRLRGVLHFVTGSEEEVPIGEDRMSTLIMRDSFGMARWRP